MAPRTKKPVTSTAADAKKATQTTVKEEAVKKAPAAAAVKTETVEETEKPEVKVAAKEEPAKKAPEKKTTTKKTTTRRSPGRPPKSAAAKKTDEVNAEVFVQYRGNEYPEKEIKSKVIAAWEADGKKASAIKRMKLYVKPEEGKAYYVINDGLKNEAIGGVDL